MIRLEQLRIDRGLTPEALAELADVGARTIRRLEAGSNANPQALYRLAQALSTDEEPVRASELRQPANGRAVA